MIANAMLNHILNETVNTIKAIIPGMMTIHHPAKMTSLAISESFAVSIVMKGDIRGKLLIHGNENAFGIIGKQMFGMELVGDMLQSFTGEFGNMIAGNLSTNFSHNNIFMDISTPRVSYRIKDHITFQHAINIPISLNEEESFQISFILE